MDREHKMQNHNPYFIQALGFVSEDGAREAARKQFIEQLGHEYVDIPIATDAKGTARYSRYRLREFLIPENKL